MTSAFQSFRRTTDSRPLIWGASIMLPLTAIRLVLAAILPLAPDETYYWVWSHALAPGYLDHPPMVALWIRVGTLLLGQTAIGVRLLGPLAALLASPLLYDAGRRLTGDACAGLAAVVLLNATLLLGVGTVIMTPDSPLLFFWTAFLWAMVRLATGGGAGWWLAAAVFGGLALDSKYTALFLWIGAGLWVLLVPAVRPWLRRWQPWAGIVVGAALFAPTLAWNAAHGWIGFIRQGGRVEDWRPARAVGFLGELVGGQIGLATPLIFALCMAGLWQAWRRRAEPAWALLLALSLPPILVFVQHAFGDRVQGNWPAIVYPALVLAAAGLVSERVTWLARSWPIAAGLGFAITAVAYLQAATQVIPLPPRLDPVAHQLEGWNQLGGDVAALARQTGAAAIAAEGYAVGSELAWNLPAGTRLIGIDAHWAATSLPRSSGVSGLLLRDARDASPLDPAVWGPSERIGIVRRPDGEGFAVYRVGTVPTGAVLPAR